MAVTINAWPVDSTVNSPSSSVPYWVEGSGIAHHQAGIRT